MNNPVLHRPYRSLTTGFVHALLADYRLAFRRHA
jgi:hypothetical protein